MRGDDARSLSQESQFERRKRAVRLHRKGHGIVQIMEMMGMAYNTVRQCIALAEVGSLAVLKPKAVERKAGQKCKLTQQQEEQVQRLMYDKRLVRRKSRSKKHTNSAPKWLSSGSMSSTQRLRKRPKHRRLKFTGSTKQPWSTPMCVDAANPPKGKTPEVYTLSGTRHKLSMIASVNNQGKAQWMMVDKAFDGATFIEFWRIWSRTSAMVVSARCMSCMDMPARASQQTSQGLAIEECRP
jgi:Winged helix-turn helix